MPSFIKDALPLALPSSGCRMIGLCRRIRRLFRLPPLLLSLFSASCAGYPAIESSLKDPFPAKREKRVELKHKM